MLESCSVCAGGDLRLLDIRPSFSNFNFVEDNFGDVPSIRRLFSQARTLKARTLIIERIKPTGTVSMENDAIRGRHPNYKMTGLTRLSFWKKRIKDQSDVHKVPSESLVAYAILKRDTIPDKINQWHIFESVVRKYPHRNNCVPTARLFHVRIVGKVFKIQGVLHCQQNGLNKACAQVAIRTIHNIYFGKDISYNQINELASKSQRFNPGIGLSARQIRTVLKRLGFKFNPVDYNVAEKINAGFREKRPYQKFLYAGLESGVGALLGFQFSSDQPLHLIPVFGHTFNCDAWVPTADHNYFHIGEETQYVSSEAWLTSFICHDDTFGSNFCIPRFYVSQSNVKFIASFRPQGTACDAVQAEAIASHYLYSMLPQLPSTENRWLRRLKQYSGEQRLVLRAICVKRDEYLYHLNEMRDWKNRPEHNFITGALAFLLPEILWMVEISAPEIFPANLRKLGEIVLDATKSSKANLRLNSFKMARFPEVYFFFEKTENPQTIPSNLLSHTPVFRYRAE